MSLFLSSKAPGVEQLMCEGEEYDSPSLKERERERKTGERTGKTTGEKET